MIGSGDGACVDAGLVNLARYFLHSRVGATPTTFEAFAAALARAYQTV